MPHASAPLRRSSIASRITGHVFLMIIASLLTIGWLVHTQLQWSIQQQADALGQSLLQQTAVSAEGALSADDTLSLAVLLRELVNNPYVSHAALYSVDNRILAEVGQRPKSSTSETGFYSQQLSLQNTIAGALHLHIDIKKLQQPLDSSMQTLAAAGLVLLILAALLSLRLGRSVGVPLQSLSNWLNNPVPPAPHCQRSDEIGWLARQLSQHFIDDTPSAEQQPNASPTPVAQASNDPVAAPASAQHSHAQTTATKSAQQVAARTAILAVEFGNMEQLRQLPSERLADLKNKYRYVLEQSAALYNGELNNLTDGRNLITFNSDHPEYPRNALLCGELLRAFSHVLQIEVADSGTILHMKLGLSDGPASQTSSLGQLLLSDSSQTALTLSQHSRNLLFLSNSLAQHSKIIACARIRSVIKPDNASCIETLLNSYPALLQSQLDHIQQQILDKHI